MRTLHLFCGVGEYLNMLRACQRMDDTGQEGEFPLFPTKDSTRFRSTIPSRAPLFL